MFFAYMRLASCGTVDARFVGPRMVTEFSVTTLWFGFGELAVATALRGAVHDHRSRGHPEDRLLREEDGGPLPGIKAVVITTSTPATTWAINSCCRW